MVFLALSLPCREQIYVAVAVDVVAVLAVRQSHSRAPSQSCGGRTTTSASRSPPHVFTIFCCILFRAAVHKDQHSLAPRLVIPQLSSCSLQRARCPTLPPPRYPGAQSMLRDTGQYDYHKYQDDAR